MLRASVPTPRPSPPTPSSALLAPSPSGRCWPLAWRLLFRRSVRSARSGPSTRPPGSLSTGPFSAAGSGSSSSALSLAAIRLSPFAIRPSGWPAVSGCEPGPRLCWAATQCWICRLRRPSASDLPSSPGARPTQCRAISDLGRRVGRDRADCHGHLRCQFGPSRFNPSPVRMELELRPFGWRWGRGRGHPGKAVSQAACPRPLPLGILGSLLCQSHRRRPGRPGNRHDPRRQGPAPAAARPRSPTNLTR